MPDLTLQKRLAAEILGVGVSRIRIDPSRVDDVVGVITRDGIKKLIDDGVITVEYEKGNSRGRWRERHKKRKAGHRRGHGSRKGKAGARAERKGMWVSTIRKLRRYLRWLRDHEVIDSKTYRRMYVLAKGGVFKSLSDLKRYLRDMGIEGIR
ncbi:MAG: 50S ribosomal protein L19e [Sulfolobales archaeon]|jgi:large subunit ribosomal protein L19e|nr:50S ribosomal protein L19e [Desulfurococcaceae archaeon]